LAKQTRANKHGLNKLTINEIRAKRTQAMISLKCSVPEENV